MPAGRPLTGRYLIKFHGARPAQPGVANYSEKPKEYNDGGGTDKKRVHRRRREREIKVGETRGSERGSNSASRLSDVGLAVAGAGAEVCECICVCRRRE